MVNSQLFVVYAALLAASVISILSASRYRGLPLGGRHALATVLLSPFLAMGGVGVVWAWTSERVLSPSLEGSIHWYLENSGIAAVTVAGGMAGRLLSQERARGQAIGTMAAAALLGYGATQRDNNLSEASTAVAVILISAVFLLLGRSQLADQGEAHQPTGDAKRVFAAGLGAAPGPDDTAAERQELLSGLEGTLRDYRARSITTDDFRRRTMTALLRLEQLDAEGG